MERIAFDTETFLIRREDPHPRMVCLSFSDGSDSEVVHVNDPACKRIVAGMLSGDFQLVGQNIAFDFGVLQNQWPEFLPLIFEAYDRDRIQDTMIRQKLIDIALGEFRAKEDGSTVGRYTLQSLAKRYQYPLDLDKDTWRMRYSELIDIPVDQWEKGAVEYSEHDAISTLWVARGQDERAREMVLLGHNTVLDDQYRQARAAWALHLMGRTGVRTDRYMVRRYRESVIRKLDESQEMLVDADILYKDPKGVWHKRTKVMREYALQANPNGPKTPLGSPKLDEDAMSAYEGFPLVQAYQTHSSATTIMKRVEELETGIDVPLRCRYEELVATGRTSCRSPNLQNRSKKGGDRECFVPRSKGKVFCIADYTGLELRTLAQCVKLIVGFSTLADAIQRGVDPHLSVAAQILGITYEEAEIRYRAGDEEVENARQVAKVMNFGLGGGIGAKRFVAQARAEYGVVITEDRARELIRSWKLTWPEMELYFNVIKAYVGQDTGDIVQIGSNRIRGKVTYTQACNSFFQGMGSDATKQALYELTKACYVSNGALRGARPVIYVHDEICTELDESIAAEASIEKERIMVEVANRWCPDAPMAAKPFLTRRWSKSAKRVERDGVLVPWEWDIATKVGSPGYAT